MKVLFCGDIVGRAGRDVVIKEVPRLRRELGLDFVAVNGENAAAGFGITAKICGELHEAGVDCITTGNHVWDQREIIPYIAQDKRLLRPINFPPGTPGWGANLFQTARGQKIVVINVMCRLFMDALDDPFRAIDAELAKYGLGGSAHFILIDVHGEATSEKQSMGHYCDGRVSAVLGTHSHIPTADSWVLPGGTAYQTDVGMCGDYDSVIGMKKEIAVQRFLKKMPGERLAPAEGEGTLCAAVVETDDRTGLARSVRPLRLGGRLAPTA
ncbi:MAG TPA: TIGR00282 family metallophosphoesterase [Reyranella sp.]|jgi:metallophosphoesterase (TIGR00282 family)|nr:TIGR00282 family metallophosphoesterase [Reyranella sp.]